MLGHDVLPALLWGSESARSLPAGVVIRIFGLQEKRKSLRAPHLPLLDAEHASPIFCFLLRRIEFHSGAAISFSIAAKDAQGKALANTKGIEVHVAGYFEGMVQPEDMYDSEEDSDLAGEEEGEEDESEDGDEDEDGDDDDDDEEDDDDSEEEVRLDPKKMSKVIDRTKGQPVDGELISPGAKMELAASDDDDDDDDDEDEDEDEDEDDEEGDEDESDDEDGLPLGKPQPPQPDTPWTLFLMDDVD